MVSDKQATNHCLAKRQAENEVARLIAEGSKLRKRISELKAERDSLLAENAEISDRESECMLKVRELTDDLRTARAEIANLKGVCKEHKAQLANTVPFDEYAADMQKAYEEGRYDEQHTDYGTSLYEQPAWEGSETKQHIDERRRANAVPVTLRNAGPGKPLHDEDPTL